MIIISNYQKQANITFYLTSTLLLGVSELTYCEVLSSSWAVRAVIGSKTVVLIELLVTDGSTDLEYMSIPLSLRSQDTLLMSSDIYNSINNNSNNNNNNNNTGTSLVGGTSVTIVTDVILSSEIEFVLSLTLNRATLPGCALYKEDSLWWLVLLFSSVLGPDWLICLSNGFPS